jgi:hypothetical protein
MQGALPFPLENIFLTSMKKLVLKITLPQIPLGTA